MLEVADGPVVANHVGFGSELTVFYDERRPVVGIGRRVGHTIDAVTVVGIDIQVDVANGHRGTIGDGHTTLAAAFNRGEFISIDLIADNSSGCLQPDGRSITGLQMIAAPQYHRQPFAALIENGTVAVARAFYVHIVEHHDLRIGIVGHQIIAAVDALGIGRHVAATDVVEVVGRDADAAYLEPIVGGCLCCCSNKNQQSGQ